MPFVCPDTMEFDLTVNGVDAAGNVEIATFATPPTWTIDEPTIATLDPAADGASCTVIATGKLGPAAVSVSGQGGPGVAPLAATFEFTVVVSAEVGFTLSASDPRPKI